MCWEDKFRFGWCIEVEPLPFCVKIDVCLGPDTPAIGSDFPVGQGPVLWGFFRAAVPQPSDGVIGTPLVCSGG